MRAHTVDDLWSLVQVTGCCWYFEGRRTHEGYGLFSIKTVNKSILAHRIVYELLVGDIGPGLQVDHICRTRNCVNPDHMDLVDAVTHSVRTTTPRMLRTTCANGHERTTDNLLRADYLRAKPAYVRCRQCVLVRTHQTRGVQCEYDSFCDAESHQRVMKRKQVVPMRRSVAWGLEGGEVA